MPSDILAALLPPSGVPREIETALWDRLRDLIAAARRRRERPREEPDGGTSGWLSFCRSFRARPDLPSYHDLLDEQYRR